MPGSSLIPFHRVLIATAIVLWVGGMAVVNGRITLGELVAFQIYLGMLLWPMIAFGWTANLFQRGAASMGRIREVMNGVPPARRWMHAYTYSGHPTCCAVALRNLKILHDERLVERAATLGAHLAARLEPLAAMEHVGHVRALGLIAAVEVVADKTTKAQFPPDAQLSQRLYDALLDRGLYTRVLFDCICLAPPLVITEAEIDRIVDIIAETIPAAVA